MGKAATRLNTSQPNVSRAISELEHAIGVRLLDRSRHGVEMNTFGRTLLDCGVAVFDDLRQAAKTIEFLNDPMVGEVRLGCSPFLAAGFISGVIERLSRRYPRISTHLVSAEVKTLHRELTERRLEFIVAPRFSTLTDDRLCYEVLFADTFSVVAGAQNPVARRRRITLADLVTEPWVLPPTDSALGPSMVQAFRASGLEFPPRVCSAPFEGRISLLTTGRFLTIIAASVLLFPSKRKDLKVLPVELPIAGAPIEIVTLKNRPTNPVANLFVEVARGLAKMSAKCNPRGDD